MPNPFGSPYGTQAVGPTDPGGLINPNGSTGSPRGAVRGCPTLLPCPCPTSHRESPTPRLRRAQTPPAPVTALTVGVLAERRVTLRCLQLVVEVTGQVLHPDRGVLGEHALALLQLLLQICQVQLQVTDRDTQPGVCRTGQKAQKKES